MTGNVDAVSRRRALVWGAAFCAASAATLQGAAAQQVYHLDVRRGPGCGCCLAWMAHMQNTGRFHATMADDDDMQAFKRSVGVPDDLHSCHTARVGGYVIEGHVPAEDVLRLLAERPRDVTGLAVPGMPLGSPGMEAGGASDRYDVIAFGANGARSVFASHGG